MRDAYSVDGVHVWGIVRGREIAFSGVLLAGDTAVWLVEQSAPDQPSETRHVPLDALEGVRAREQALTLYLVSGDVIEITGQESLAEAATQITRKACIFPEQTLRLRAFGSPRGAPGEDHDRFFGPLLEARRRVEEADSAEERVSAFDAPALHERTEQLLHQFAVERHPRSGPDQRALEAELFDLAERYLHELDELGRAALVWRDSADDARFACWRVWAATVQRVFEHADAAWMGMVPPLADTPRVAAAARPLWRRLLRLTAVAAVAALPGLPALVERWRA